MKKTVILIILIVLTLFAITACASEEGFEENSAPSTGSDPTPAPSSKTYTITWVDENGTVLTSKAVKEGETPSYSYSLQDTAEWDYTMVGWSSAANGEVLTKIPDATANATYYAVVTATKQVYTVTFTTLGGSNVATQSVEYGKKASLPEPPTYSGHKFVGWSTSATESIEVNFDAAITGDVEYFAVWNEVVDVKALLLALLNGYKANPYSYIPNSMKFDYNANLIDTESIITDYSGNVNVSDITYGFGEQWHMVLDNIDQSMLFFNTLSVVEALSTTSIVGFNNYFDQNPADTAHYEFENGIYNVSIKFDGEVIFYVVDYTADFPVFGTVSAQIALSMKIKNGEKNVRVQIGDSNALTYTVSENHYEFAIKYLDKRTAIFSINRNNNGSVSGKIYEFLYMNDTSLISSAADFYIAGDYVSVVGNKADGIVGFNNTICEVYDISTGRLIGYEISETQQISGIAVNFDTLWFNLNDVTGINTIKYIPKTDTSEAKLYINGSTDVWKVKLVGGFSLTTLSRRYDIEFRTQYVTTYDSVANEYVVHKIQVPMIFVQEAYYDTLSDDVKSENESLAVHTAVDSTDLGKLISEYEELIPVFNDNKALYTKELVIAYIGDKITFE